MKTLHYVDPQPGAQGYGWATCNRELQNALAEYFTLSGPDAEIVFNPIGDHNLNPISPRRGKINLGYCFFESELGPNVEGNAAQFDIVFCGSTWCKERLAERGIHNAEVLIQGVDHSIFYPRERKPDGKFKIFSGGKFEYRKGQDLVIRAFAEFMKDHPDAHLVCAWFNPWPQIIGASLLPMHESSGLEFRLTEADIQSEESIYAKVIEQNGIPRDRFTILPPLTQPALAEAMAQTDCGLFPNRCEGGTNLVLMEYAAMGLPTVANGRTGHLDIIDTIHFGIQTETDAMGWAVQSVEGIVAALERVQQEQEHSAKFGVPQWPWKRSAETVWKAVERLHYGNARAENEQGENR